MDMRAFDFNHLNNCVGKVLLLMAILCMTSMSVNSQKITTDGIRTDGERQIMAKTRNFNVEGAGYSIGMEVFVSKRSANWCLLISSYYYMSSRSQVLLRLGNDEIIHLWVNNVNQGTIHSSGFGYTIGSYTAIVPPSEADYYSALYEITVDELDRIEKHGISKIRISDGVTNRDRNFPSNTLGKYLTKCRKKIKERMSSSPPATSTSSIYDNF